MLERKLGMRDRVRFVAGRAWRSPLLRNVIALRGWPAFRREMRSSEPLTIDVNSRIGMGAILSYVLRIHAWAEEKNREVRVISTSPLYTSDGKDILARFFQRSDQTVAPTPMSQKAGEVFYRLAMPSHIDLQQTQALASKWLQPRADVLNIIERIAGDEPFDLSIHYRGTDKFLDSGVTPYSVLLDAAEPYLSKANRVFLATDDPACSMILKSTWPGIEFVSYDAGDVPEGTPRHFSSLPAEQKAEEAIYNMLLLSRAPVCVRTSSFMSSFARIFNPGLRTVTINKTVFRNTPYPEKQIIAAEMAGL